METIFNKSNSGVDEIRKYFSQISGTIDYDEINPDVVTAQDEVARYLGAEMVQKAITHYRSENYQATEPTAEFKKLDMLVELTQNAVALWAYRDFARNKDVTHTGTGRVARMDKDQDEVNLRLIDADDLALLQKALKAMDRLIRFVDNEQFEEWKNSVQYKETRELLIWNADLFDKYYPIERNRRVFLLLVPMIRKVQIDRIQSRLGSELYAELLAKVKTLASDSLDSSESSGSGSGAGLSSEDQYLYDLVCYPITEFAMAEAYLKLPVQLFTESMAKQFWNAGNGSAALTMLEKMSAEIESKGKESLARLETELELRAAKATVPPTAITDDTIVDIADRMDAGNMFARV